MGAFQGREDRPNSRTEGKSLEAYSAALKRGSHLTVRVAMMVGKTYWADKDGLVSFVTASVFNDAIPGESSGRTIRRNDSICLEYEIAFCDRFLGLYPSLRFVLARKPDNAKFDRRFRMIDEIISDEETVNTNELAFEMLHSNSVAPCKNVAVVGAQ